MKIEVHTLRWGNLPWLVECSASLDAWAAKHGMPVTVWGKEPMIEHGYPCEKFCEIDMLRAFLAGDADRLIYVDADVLVHPFAPRPEFKPGFHMMPDRVGAWSREWPVWCMQHLKEKPFNFTYRNAGVWSCDRESAEKMLKVIAPPFVARWQDQHQWNFWIWKAQKTLKMKLHDLPALWNCFPENKNHAWFYHASGRHKDAYLADFKTRFKAPMQVESFVELPQLPDVERAIVIPYSQVHAKWEELRHCLRSIERNFLDKECPILVICDERPDWLSGGTPDPRLRVMFGHSYEEALAIGIQSAEQILWMNDDQVFLQPVNWGDFTVPRSEKLLTYKEARGHGRTSNPYRNGMERVFDSLASYGIDRVHDYSTHLPYLFERRKALETLRRHGIWRKMPFETLYYNEWFEGVPRRVQGFLAGNLTGGKEAVLNYSDRKDRLNQALKDFLEKSFPDPSPWEAGFPATI